MVASKAREVQAKDTERPYVLNELVQSVGPVRVVFASARRVATLQRDPGVPAMPFVARALDCDRHGDGVGSRHSRSSGTGLTV